MKNQLFYDITDVFHSARLNETVSDCFKPWCGDDGKFLVHCQHKLGLRGRDDHSDWYIFFFVTKIRVSTIHWRSRLMCFQNCLFCIFHSRTSGLPCNDPRPLEGSFELVDYDPEDETVKVELCSNGGISGTTNYVHLPLSRVMVT